MGLIKYNSSKKTSKTESREHRDTVSKIYGIITSFPDVDKRNCDIEHPLPWGRRADIYIEYMGHCLGIEVDHKHFDLKDYNTKEEDCQEHNLKTFHVLTKESMEYLIDNNLTPNAMLKDLHRRYGGVYYFNNEDTLNHAIWDGINKKWDKCNKPLSLHPRDLIHVEDDYQGYITAQYGYCLDYHKECMEEDIEEENNYKKEAFDEMNKKYAETFPIKESSEDYSYKYANGLSYEEVDKEYIMELIEEIPRPDGRDWNEGITLGVKYNGEYYYLHSPTEYVLTVFRNNGPGQYRIIKTSTILYRVDENGERHPYNKMDCIKLD